MLVRTTGMDQVAKALGDVFDMLNEIKGDPRAYKKWLKDELKILEDNEKNMKAVADMLRKKR